MPKLVLSLSAVAIAGIAFVASVQPSSSVVIYPWCAHYGGRVGGGAANCGFTTWEQCMATVSGTQGTCEMNPWYEPPAPRVQQRVEKRRQGSN